MSTWTSFHSSVGNFREASFRQRLAGRDDLHDRRVAGGQIEFNRRDQRRRLHRRDQMAEEALLRAFERRARGGLGLSIERTLGRRNVCRFQRRIEIVVNDREGAGIGVVDADLLFAEAMLEHFVGDALIGQRTRGIETERLEIARQHFHGGDAAGFDRLDEFRPCRKREILAAPQAEPLSVGEIVHRRRAGGGDIDDAGVGQGVLQPQPGATLLRGCLAAALALRPGGVGHGVALVEDDDAVEILAQPVDDLLDPRGLNTAPFDPSRS